MLEKNKGHIVVLIKSYEFKIPNLDPLTWVESQQNTIKFYLKLRDTTNEWAGVGNIFDSPKSLVPTLDWALEDYEDFLNEVPDIKYFIANKFNLFSNVVLPRFEVSKIHDTITFKVNLWRSESVDEFKNKFKKITTPENNKIIDIQHSPSKESWPQYFHLAKQTLKENDKIVLARKTHVNFENELNAYDILRKLNQNSYQCLFQLDGEIQNISVSPERLFKIAGTTLYTEAVAGTRPRGLNYEEDKRLEDELKISAKDQHEHQLVVNEILKILQNFSIGISFDETKVIKQKTVQHLKTEIQTDIINKTTTTEILKQLHPTPAVGGLPREKSLNWLSENEPFGREYYAAPIGIMSQNFSEFFVNIRSAQIQNNQMKLFSGVGIVQESEVQAEWNELESKTRQYWDALR